MYTASGPCDYGTAVLLPTSSVGAPHRNRKAAGSIPAREPIQKTHLLLVLSNDMSKNLDIF
jgi:hypothetical protein